MKRFSEFVNESVNKSINKDIVNFYKPYIKNPYAIKNFNYHLFTDVPVLKLQGEKVYVVGIYIKDKQHKIVGVHLDREDEFTVKIVKISESKFIAYAAKWASIIADNITPIEWNAQADKLKVLLQDEFSKRASVVPGFNDLRALYNFLGNNLKSVKGFYGIWNTKNGEMGITLPFTFKPTIAKFAEERSVSFYINFTDNELSHNTISPKYNDEIGDASETIGNFKDTAELLAMIKKEFTVAKKEIIKNFNASDANDWKR